MGSSEGEWYPPDTEFRKGERMRPFEGVKILDCTTAEHTRDEFTLLGVGIGHACELHAGKSGEDAGMIGAHHPDADDPNA